MTGKQGISPSVGWGKVRHSGNNKAQIDSSLLDLEFQRQPIRVRGWPFASLTVRNTLTVRVEV